MTELITSPDDLISLAHSPKLMNGITSHLISSKREYYRTIGSEDLKKQETKSFNILSIFDKSFIFPKNRTRKKSNQNLDELELVSVFESFYSVEIIEDYTNTQSYT